MKGRDKLAIYLVVDLLGWVVDGLFFVGGESGCNSVEKKRQCDRCDRSA